MTFAGGVPAGGAIVLVRHGQSIDNERGVLTGWSDPPLSASGVDQSLSAGMRLRRARIAVDVVHTSRLTRARQTAGLLVAALGATPETCTHWELNERHLGALQGLTRDEIVERWGNRARQRWRSAPEARPPAIHGHDADHPRNQAGYVDVPAWLLPGAESIRDVSARVATFFDETLRPELDGGATIVVVAHRDTIRALMGLVDEEEDRTFAERAVAHAPAMVMYPTGRLSAPFGRWT